MKIWPRLLILVGLNFESAARPKAGAFFEFIQIGNIDFDINAVARRIHYEGAERAAANKKELSSEEESELRMLWKKLVCLYHPDRFAGEADTIDTYEKLTSAINRAKQEGDIELLREIASDPNGFILRQGWTRLDFSDANEIEGLRKLLDTLNAEIVNKLDALNNLHESSDYELHQLSSRRPSLLDEAGADLAKASSAEIAQLETEAEKLKSEIAGLAETEEAPIM